MSVPQKRLRDLMQREGLTSRSVAALVGVHPVTVRRWMSGQSRVPDAVLMVLENAMPKVERKPYTHEATMLFEKVGGAVGSRTVRLYETGKMWCISPHDRFRKDTGQEYGTRGFRFHRKKWLDLESIAPVGVTEQV